jgi:hypothetical protein
LPTAEKPNVLIPFDTGPIRAAVRSPKAGTRCPRSVAPSRTRNMLLSCIGCP